MENHTFGEPVPVVHYSISSDSNNDVVTSSDQQNEVEPSWTVDVIRKGSNVVVGTIVINNTKLPPRRNKNKKIVWKLPASSSTNTEEDIPRFGKQDYPRLWEIYKEEKKKRRSVNKTTGTNFSSNISIDDDSNNNNIDYDNNSVNKRDQMDGNESEHVCETVDHEIISKISRNTNNGHSRNTNHTITYPSQVPLATSNMTMIAPPPGFETSTTTSATTTTTTTTSIIRPPPGFS